MKRIVLAIALLVALAAPAMALDLEAEGVATSFNYFEGTVTNREICQNDCIITRVIISNGIAAGNLVIMDYTNSNVIYNATTGDGTNAEKSIVPLYYKSATGFKATTTSCAGCRVTILYKQ